MFHKITVEKVYGLVCALLPILFSLICVIAHSFGLISLLPVVLIVSIALNPYSRKYENIWMFVLVAIASIPVNVMFIKYLSELFFDEVLIFPLILFRSAALYVMFLSLEELLLGIVARVIWKEQWEISISSHLYKQR